MTDDKRQRLRRALGWAIGSAAFSLAGMSFQSLMNRVQVFTVFGTVSSVVIGLIMGVVVYNLKGQSVQDGSVPPDVAASAPPSQGTPGFAAWCKRHPIYAGLGYASIAVLFILIPTFTGHGPPDWTMLLIGGGLFGLFGGIGSYFGRPPRIGGG